MSLKSKIPKKPLSYLVLSVIVVPLLLALGLDFRFGPDLRLSTKVIDPKDSEYNPKSFLVADYNDYQDLFEALKGTFKFGSSPEEIEGVLQNSKLNIKVNPILRKDEKLEKQLIYSVSSSGYWPSGFLCRGRSSDQIRIEFTFDEADELRGIRIFEPCNYWATFRVKELN
ncbi:hypothetical protein [uncultured Roseobacter sp.]|uniref:hypothetical protein n=1 Tax=uncultured Roseobacter sp. TaxID=114847 RepID=UPI00262DB73F|nr:hypothetical protein [uncultured Roseobacter sp.]